MMSDLSSPGVSLAEFLAALFSTGQVGVGRGVDLSHGQEAATRVLQGAYQEMLEELPLGEDAEADEGIVLDVPMGLAAGRYLYAVCLALADRVMSAEQVTAVCAALPPEPRTAAELLSADLVLRHLPEIDRMARAMGDDDPLVKGLQLAAARFPLSSVGMPLDREPDVDLRLVRRSKALWRMYVDRIIEWQDEGRLRDPAVAAGVRDALGLHTKLAPRLAARLAVGE
jgi:hypothetical protein